MHEAWPCLQSRGPTQARHHILGQGAESALNAVSKPRFIILQKTLLVPDLTIGASTTELRNLWLVAAAGLGGDNISNGTGGLSRGRFEGIRDGDTELDAIMNLARENTFGALRCRKSRSIASAYGTLHLKSQVDASQVRGLRTCREHTPDFFHSSLPFALYYCCRFHRAILAPLQLGLSSSSPFFTYNFRQGSKDTV